MQMLGSNETGEKIMDDKEEKSKAAEATDGAKAEKQNGSTEVKICHVLMSSQASCATQPWLSYTKGFSWTMHSSAMVRSTTRGKGGCLLEEQACS